VDRLTVRANPKCRNCLGSGIAATRYAGVTHVCPCVTEQLRIIIVDKDYRIPAEERYEPGHPEFADSEGNLVEDPQNLAKAKLPKPYKTGTMNEVLQWEK
jgi:hypothetical protein